MTRLLNWFVCGTVILYFCGKVGNANQIRQTEGNLHADIAQFYGFQPHALDDKQLKEKSALLDQFWLRATEQSEAYARGLRKELADFTNPPFFLYDGSKLLLKISTDPADRKIALAAIARSDLRDLQPNDYFAQVHYLATLGENTTEAAFHILEDPKFQVFIPGHALTLAQNYALIYLLIPTNQTFWLKPAITRIESEQDETAQKSLLLLLMYAQMPESDKAIRDFATNARKPSASRKYADELIQDNTILNLYYRATAIISNEETLRKERQERMKAVSDEALMDSTRTLPRFTQSVSRSELVAPEQ